MSCDKIDAPLVVQRGDSVLRHKNWYSETRARAESFEQPRRPNAPVHLCATVTLNAISNDRVLMEARGEAIIVIHSQDIRAAIEPVQALPGAPWWDEAPGREALHDGIIKTPCEKACSPLIDDGWVPRA